MQLVTGKEAVQRVRNLINDKQQIHGYSVDLTAKQIYRLDPTGHVDFGGSEYVAAERHPLPAHQKHSQDRYQWWTLVHGAYAVEFNEVLELGEGEVALLEPNDRLLRAGADIPSQYLRGSHNPLSSLISVTCAQVHIKQNARVATLRVFLMGGAPGKAAKKKR